MEHTAILGAEMDRCARELNTLRTAGLEAELLGAGAQKMGWDDVRRGALIVQKTGRKDAPSRGRVASVDEEDEFDGDDYDEDEPAAPPAVKGGGNEYWKMLADSLDAAHIQSEEQMREYIIKMVTSGKFGKMDPRLRGKFDGLVTTVLRECLPFMDLLQKEPAPGPSMQLYGLAMVVISEYKRLSRLRALVRQDMLVFVQFYERSAVRNVQRTNRLDKDRYMHFYDYYADVCDPASAKHVMGVKMALRVTGVDIMRCMLVAATHLVELIVVLGLCRKLGQ
jgi:hypothetical protein